MNTKLTQVAKLTQFKKGQSGNPGGRPKGAKNRRSPSVQDLLSVVIEVPPKLYAPLKKLFPTIEPQMSLEELATLQQLAKLLQTHPEAYLALRQSGYGSSKRSTPAEVQPIDNDVDPIDMSLGCVEIGKGQST